MPTDYHHLNLQHLALREEIAALNHQLKKLVNKIEKQLDEEFSAAFYAVFPKEERVYCPWSVHGTELYFSHFFAKDPNTLEVVEYNFLEDFTWGKADPDDSYGYGIPLDEPAPVEASVVKKFLDNFAAANDGIKVEIVTLKLRKLQEPDPKAIRSFAAIKALFANSEVKLLAKGKRAYLGWDIEDRWMLVSIDGKKCAWWSNSDYDNAMSHQAIEGTPNWESWLLWRSDEGCYEERE